MLAHEPNRFEPSRRIFRFPRKETTRRTAYTTILQLPRLCSALSSRYHQEILPCTGANASNFV